MNKRYNQFRTTILTCISFDWKYLFGLSQYAFTRQVTRLLIASIGMLVELHGFIDRLNAKPFEHMNKITRTRFTWDHEVL